MALVLKIRPRERLVVNGAVILNPSEHSISLHLLNKANLLHERDILLPEKAETPIAHLYLQVQAMLLEPLSAEDYQKNFIQIAAKIYAQAMIDQQHDICNLITDTLRLVGEGNIYRALRSLKSAARGGKPVADEDA